MPKRTVFEELSELLELEQKKGESDQKFFVRMGRESSDLEDEDFDSLSEDAQSWCNTAIKAIKGKRKLKAPDGFEDEVADEVEEDEVEEDEVEEDEVEEDDAVEDEEDDAVEEDDEVEDDDEDEEIEDDYEEEEEEPPPPKKKRGRPAKKKVAAPKKKRGRPAKKKVEEDEVEEEAPTPTPRRRRKKAPSKKAVTKVEEDEVEEPTEEPVEVAATRKGKTSRTKKAKSRRRRVTTADDPDAVTRKRSMLQEAAYLVVKNPGTSPQEIKELGAAKGITLEGPTWHALRYHIRLTLKALKRAGLLRGIQATRDEDDD